MTKREYYRKVWDLSTSRPWNLTRQILSAVTIATGSILAAIFLLPSLAPHLPMWRNYMANVTALAALFFGLFLLGIIFFRFVFHAPYWFHQEQEQEMNQLKETFTTHEAFTNKCEYVANLILEGQKICDRYRRSIDLIPANVGEEWIDRTHLYLENMFGSSAIVQWENPTQPASSPPISNEVPGANQRMYNKLFRRLENLRTFHQKLEDQRLRTLPVLGSPTDKSASL